MTLGRLRRWAVLWAGISAAMALAAREPIDGVVAVVNDDVILASEVGEEVSTRLYQMGPRASEVRDLDKFTGEVLADMVDRRLLLQDADAHNIVVTREDIQPYLDEQLENVRRSFPGDEEYRDALARYGMTEKTLAAKFRANIRDDIKISRLTEEVLAPRIKYDEDNLRAFFNAHRDEFTIPTTLTLREIAVAVKPSVESAARLKEALEDLRRQAIMGGDFVSLGQELAAREGGECGASFSFLSGEAVPELEAAAAGLAPGGISSVKTGADGLWLVRLNNVDGAKRDVSYINLPLKAGLADRARARARAEEAAAALARGETFEKVAAAYSDNKETAGAGGLVGEIALERLVETMPEVARAVADLSVGDTTPIVERPEGYFIIRLDARAEGRAVDYDEAREAVKRAVRGERLLEEQEKYLEEMKTKAYIRVFE